MKKTTKTPAPRYFALPLDTEGKVTAADVLCSIVADSFADNVLGSDLTPAQRAEVVLPRVVQTPGFPVTFLVVPSSSAAWLSDACAIHAEFLDDRRGSDEIGEWEATEALGAEVDAEILRAQRCARAGF